jgi:hypothetical protein
MSDVRTWLADIGLGQYADAFEANNVEMDLLKDVDDQTLKDIGVTSAGHRLRLRGRHARSLEQGGDPGGLDRLPRFAQTPSGRSALARDERGHHDT